jgi:hypothetical protein
MRGVAAPPRTEAAAAWDKVADASARRDNDAGERATTRAAEGLGIDWARFADDPIGRLRAIDRILVDRGFHPMPAWWDEQIAEFYKSGKFQFTARVGRRGGKSSTASCRLAVSESIGTPRTLSPGEAGTWVLISHTSGEALDRLDTIEAILKALDFRQVEGRPQEFGTYQRTTEKGRSLIRSFDFQRNVIEWTVFPASINGVSGPTAIGASCDEAAKWRDDKTGANPATVVLASLRPCFATQPAAHLYLISSAFSTIDAHHEAVKEGDTDRQYIARMGDDGAAIDREQRERVALAFEARASAARIAGNAVDAKVYGDRADAVRASIDTIDRLSANVPTWVANPSLSIERTLALEDDFATWLREYASVPVGASGGSFLDHVVVDAMCIIIPRVPMGYTCGIDPGLSTNSFAAVFLGFDRHDAWVVDMLELLPQPGAPLDDEESFTLCAEHARTWYCKAWATDGHYIATARRIGGKHGLSTILAPNDNGPVFLAFRKALVRRGFSFGGHAMSVRLARQLKGIVGKPGDGARTKILLTHEAGGAHGDLASAAVRGHWLATQGGQLKPPLSLPKMTSASRTV